MRTLAYIDSWFRLRNGASAGPKFVSAPQQYSVMFLLIGALISSVSLLFAYATCRPIATVGLTVLPNFLVAVPGACVNRNITRIVRNARLSFCRGRYEELRKVKSDW